MEGTSFYDRKADDENLSFCNALGSASDTYRETQRPANPADVFTRKDHKRTDAVLDKMFCISNFRGKRDCNENSNVFLKQCRDFENSIQTHATVDKLSAMGTQTSVQTVVSCNPYKM